MQCDGSELNGRVGFCIEPTVAHEDITTDHEGWDNEKRLVWLLTTALATDRERIATPLLCTEEAIPPAQDAFDGQLIDRRVRWRSIIPPPTQLSIEVHP